MHRIGVNARRFVRLVCACLLYTSDAADERSSVDLGGRRIIKKKNKERIDGGRVHDRRHNKKRAHIQGNGYEVTRRDSTRRGGR